MQISFSFFVRWSVRVALEGINTLRGALMRLTAKIKSCLGNDTEPEWKTKSRGCLAKQE